MRSILVSVAAAGVFLLSGPPISEAQYTPYRQPPPRYYQYPTHHYYYPYTYRTTPFIQTAPPLNPRNIFYYYGQNQATSQPQVGMAKPFSTHIAASRKPHPARNTAPHPGYSETLYDGEDPLTYTGTDVPQPVKPPKPPKPPLKWWEPHVHWGDSLTTDRSPWHQMPWVREDFE